MTNIGIGHTVDNKTIKRDWNHRANFTQKVDYAGKTCGNFIGMDLKSDMLVAGTLGATVLANSQLRHKASSFIDDCAKDSPKIGKYLKGAKDFAAKTFNTVKDSKIAEKAGGVITKLKETELAKTVIKGLDAIPGPVKAVALILGAGFAANTAYKQGTIDQKFHDSTAMNDFVR